MPEPADRRLNRNTLALSLGGSGSMQVSLGPRFHTRGLFLATAEERGLSRVRSCRRPVGDIEPDRLLPLLGDPAFGWISWHTGTALIEEDGCLVAVEVSGGFAEISAAGDDTEQVDRAIERTFARLPEPEDPDLKTTLLFWSQAGEGAMHSTCAVEPRTWADIEAGYPAATRGALEGLMAREGVPAVGRLLLWHGEPGTGKTNAIRALAHEWRSWCDASVITDPERLIGGPMGYLREVLEGPRTPGESRPGHLVVLEDSGELLAADARSQSGQGLSRLLNVSDGLLGLKRDTIILITTNEPIGRLHPAVHRPGRCLAEVEFGALDVDEASDWLAARAVTDLVTEPKTLAQLYAIADGRDQGTRRLRVGFG